MMPPRLPLGPSEAAAVAYTVQLVMALEAKSGNVRAAADSLGIERRTFDRHLVALGLAGLRTAYSRSGRQPKARLS